MKITKLLSVILLAASLASCCGNATKKDDCCGECKSETKAMKTPFKKKYTNADFYTDGKFNEDVAIKAYKEMLAHYDVPFTETLEQGFWVAEFGTGDFENCGMGGIFWINDEKHRYFGHEIYLLPGQMIPEHKHVETEYPAKFECWMVRHGSVYNFSEVGDPTPNAPTIPASQAATTISKNFVEQPVGPVVELKEIETFHFLLAGDEGAIVTEFATYHDGAGLRFSNPKAKL
ncbi:MAG: hypothetical protein R3Y26_06565 [Rikenellaceae bacterium]